MTTVTASSAAADLLADVRLLLARHDSADSLPDLEAIADELTTALRRVRGRVRRLKKQLQQPAEPERPAPPTEPKPTVPPEPRPPDPPPRAETQSVSKPTHPANAAKPTEGTSAVATTEPTPTPTAPTAAQPRKRRHIFRWFFLAVQLLFLAWIIFGVGGAAAENCDGETGAALEACQAGTTVGAGIGAGLIIGLWVAVDIILGLTYLIFRKR